MTMPTLRRLLTLCLACTCLFTPSAPAQTLARPGWVGSGMNTDVWWKHAIVYQVNPLNFNPPVDNPTAGSGLQRRQTGQERLEIVRVAPGRDDDADSQTRFCKVSQPIHYGFFNRRARARSRARRSDAVRLLIPCFEIFSRTGSMDS